MISFPELSPAAVRTDTIRQESFTWPSTLLDQLRALSASEGVNLFIGVLAGLETLLYRYTGQDEFVLRCLIPECTNGDRYQVLAPFADATRIKSDFRGNPSFRDVIAQVREVVQDGDRDNTLHPGQFPRVLFTATPDNGQQNVPHLGSSGGSTDHMHQLPPSDFCLAVWVDGGVLKGNVRTARPSSIGRPSTG